MPSSVSLDLGAWSKFLPQERNNDPDYNQLLHKFKQFYNEVKDFQELHSDCSVTRAAIASAKATVNFNQQQQRHNRNGFRNILSNDFAIDIFKNKILPPLQDPPQHHSSSYNLSTGLTRPEAKQRNAIRINAKVTQSRSSERLDNLNNNSIGKVKAANSPGPPHSLNRYSEDEESNIYDAVSPEDALYINNQRAHNSIDEVRNSQVGSLNVHINHKLKDQDKSNKTSCNDNSGSSSGNEANCFGNSDSLSSSNLLDVSATSYSVSSLSNTFNNYGNDSKYANYVNIDYFLKRRQSPSFDHSDDEDITQMSHSLSTDQIFADEATAQNINSAESSGLPHKRSDDSTEGTLSSVDMGLMSIIPPTAPPLTNSFHSVTKLSSLSDHSLRSTQTDKDEKSRNVSKFNSFMASNSDHKRGSHKSISRESLLNDDRRLHVIAEDKNQKECSHLTRSSSNNNASETSKSPEKLSHLDEGHNNEPSLAGAHQMMQSFLSDLNSASDNLFQNEDKSQRRIVKESFAVECCGKRKLRHLFLFNDVIVCAKYQASSKQKFTFDVKWYLSLIDVSIPDSLEQSQQRVDKDTVVNQILTFKTNLCLLRNQIEHLKRTKQKPSSRIIKKLKKKKTELEAELVLLLPHLPLTIQHNNGRKYTFFLSSNFERNQWIDSIKVLQNQLNINKSDITPSSSELQAWIQTCRKNLNPNLGSFLLRSNSDEDLFYGDLNLSLCRLQGLNKKGNYYFCFEVDSYGHFFQKASSAIIKNDKADSPIDEEFVIPLDGTHTMRFLFYEDLGINSKSTVMGKAPLELSRSWFDEKPVEKVITFGANCSLVVRLSYSSSELFSSRFPNAKIYPNFGVDVQQVCKKEKSLIPLLVQLCVREVERRGMKEVGIYRISALSSDIQRLRKAYETNSYCAELLLREIDIHSVTGLLKMYLREMPEALFTNKLYSKFVAAFNLPQSKIKEKERELVKLFSEVPPVNQRTIIYLIEHLVKVNKFESYNKMSLANLATVFGLNMIRPPHVAAAPVGSQSASSTTDGDPFTAVVISSMSQAGILYFFLCRKSTALPFEPTPESDDN